MIQAENRSGNYDARAQWWEDIIGRAWLSRHREGETGHRVAPRLAETTLFLPPAYWGRNG
jgi:hypothetical protein